jgi:hypothetical protein
MTSRLPFIDSDAHVLEPVGMFEKYLEPKFRDWMPYACADYQRRNLWRAGHTILSLSAAAWVAQP